MAFKYACFISYCHGQHELVKGFVDQLKTALKAELETLIDEDIYIDDERLKPGHPYNEDLAKAICQSVCMVVVYMPKYERHEYCIREFEGMRLLAQKRRQLLGVVNDTRDFIIPVILRGDDDIPERIRQHTHYANFARFSLATPDILHNPEYVAEVRKIADVVYEWYKAFENVPADPCAPCTAFTLPPAAEVAPWRPPFVNS
jgi:TIR domain